MIPQRVPKPVFVRALNRGGRTIQRTGIRLVWLDDQRLIEEACQRAGLDDFGGDGFREPLERLVASLDREAKLNLIGRIAARTDLLRLLSSDLEMERDRKQHPGIREEVIRRPILVTGLPRTGTTLLHGLLAQDPANRAPLTWEMMFPSPPPRRRLSRGDRRIDAAERQLRWFHRLSPGFRCIHPTGARLPEECQVITSHGMVSFQFQTMYDVPSYQAWLEQQNLLGCYEKHRQFLQHLQWDGPPARWVLKAPAHLFGMEAVYRVYPDALTILTHRAPLEVVASLASLTAVLRGTFSDDVVPSKVGHEMSERWARGLERALAFRDAGGIPQRQVLDVLYPDLVRDPIGVVKQIYRRFDFAWTPRAEQRMRVFLERNPKDGQGRHRYSLEEFGLDREEESARYGAYARRFGI